MRIPGDAARLLCRTMVAQWADDLPDGFTVTIGGTRSWCLIKAEKMLTADDIRRMGEQGRREGSVRVPVYGSARRFGTGLPVGSQRSRQRRMIADIAAELRGCVEGALDEPWPAADVRVRTEVRLDSIRVWFEGVDGVRRLPASVAFDELGQR